MSYRERVFIVMCVAGMLASTAFAEIRQTPEGLLAEEVMAVAYSGFREGQHPDRGYGAMNPSDDDILEDLNILVAHNFELIRLYDSGDNSRVFGNEC